MVFSRGVGVAAIAVRGRAWAVASLCALLLFVALSCTRPQPYELEDPTEAAKVFLTALDYQAGEMVWEFLLPEDREVLEARKAEFDALTDVKIERKAWEFLSPGHIISSPAEYKGVTVDEGRSDGDNVVVVVELQDESTFDLPMVHKGARWYVDLPLESLSEQDSAKQRGM